MTATEQMIPAVLAAFREGRFTTVSRDRAYDIGWRGLAADIDSVEGKRAWETEPVAVWEDAVAEVWAIHVPGEPKIEFTIPEGGAVVDMDGNIEVLI